MEPIGRVYSVFERHRAVSTDSRRISPGCVFVALRGERHDGNRFAGQALAQGAALAVVDNPEHADTNDDRMLLVPSALSFLQELARAHRARLRIPVIGLTGSNGKTTTKELLGRVLEQQFATFTTQGNLNNHIGVPLSILAITPEHQVAVVEMGANHQGEVAQLCRIARPTHGLITNVGKAHLEGFGSLEGVKKGKGELYDFLGQAGGMVFIDQSNAHLTAMLADRQGFGQVVAYGASAQRAHLVGGREPLLTVRIAPPDAPPLEMNTQLTGEYNLNNVLAAIRVGEHFGVAREAIKRGIEGYQPANNRSQLLETGRNAVILDAYNANPSSMEVALEGFARMPCTRPKAVILGQMLELGGYAAAEHRRIARLAVSLGFDRVILVGSPYRHTAGASCLASMDQCRELLRRDPIAGCTVLIKGSRGARMEAVVDLL